MEPERTKHRLWMKGFKSRRQDSARNTGRQSTVRVPERRVAPAHIGTTGLGFRLSVTVCPKLDQVYLAFSTLLFIISIDLLVLTVVNVGPGLLSRKFTPTSCTIVDKSINTSTYCYITAIENHGKIIGFPCLQIYVTTNTTSSMTSQLHTTQYSEKNGVIEPFVRPVEKSGLQDGAEDATQRLLLYQNELHLAGGDYIHRPCSYLPSYCSGNTRDIAWQVYNYSMTIGEVNASIGCHYSDSSGLAAVSKGIAMKERVVTEAQIVHTILWPCIGIAISILCCSAFWKQNRNRVSRLFIYNSWSPS